MIESTTFEFPFTAPDGYSYEFTQFNTRLVAIWLLHSFPYSYTSKQVKSIWGFYNLKKKEYYAPINSIKVGDKVNINDTRNYTAMQLNLTPLEKCFL
jgi:hypothetical protein